MSLSKTKMACPENGGRYRWKKDRVSSVDGAGSNKVS